MGRNNPAEAKGKTERQQTILRLIQEHPISRQEVLLDHLRQEGFEVTQATISRDIKQLRLVKELAPSGSYRYVAADRQEGKSSAGRLRNIFKEGVVSVEAAQNLVVVKTMPGLASAACSALDGMEIAGMVGSLAGDDTGMLIMRDSASAEAFCSEAHKLLE